MIPAHVLDDSMRQAKAKALGLTRYHPELRDDAIGDAMLGLAQAIAVYDPALVPIEAFSAYASIRIRGAILDGMRSGERKRQYRGKGKARGTKRQDRDEVTYSADVRPLVLDIDAPDIAERLGYSDDHATRFESRRTLAQLLERCPLSDRERAVLARFSRGAPNGQIARELGVCASRITQLRDAALDKIRLTVSHG